MKKTALIFAVCAVVCACFAGCGGQQKPQQEKVKPEVVCSLFPQYDFVREIAGDRVNLTLLLKPGTDSHSYDPTPSDTIKINSADLFIYTGAMMESWAEKLISSVDSASLETLDLSRDIKLLSTGDEHEEEHGEEHEDEHDHSVDPHIWTSPVNAMKMVEKIRDELCLIDPDSTDFYTANADAYLQKLNALDSEIRDIVSNGKRNKIVFGSRFAVRYFAEEYSLEWLAAFDSCTEDTEPSPAAKIRLINTIKEEKIPVVFCEELSNGKVAQSIADETGTQVLVFHSCHNLSSDDFKAGEGYLSLMEKNAENLRIALA